MEGSSGAAVRMCRTLGYVTSLSLSHPIAIAEPGGLAVVGNPDRAQDQHSTGACTRGRHACVCRPKCNFGCLRHRPDAHRGCRHGCFPWCLLSSAAAYGFLASHGLAWERGNPRRREEAAKPGPANTYLWAPTARQQQCGVREHPRCGVPPLRLFVRPSGCSIGVSMYVTLCAGLPR